MKAMKQKKAGCPRQPALLVESKLINCNLDSASSLYWQEAVVVE